MAASISNSLLLSSPSNSKPISTQNPFRYTPFQSRTNPNRISSRSPLPTLQIRSGIRELRERIDSVKSTQKITEATKLIAAARVRRAQEAVISSRPFTETLVEILQSINQTAQLEDIEFPLSNIRIVKRVALVVVTGDKGLCGGFNNAVTKKADLRIKELKSRGIDCVVVSVGKKGNSYFSRRDEIEVDKFIEGGSVFPTAKEAQVIADDVFSLFVSEEVDKVELVYTKFVSLVKSDHVIHTLLPLALKGESRDANGDCVDAMEDEMFRLTSKDGKLAVERRKVEVEKPEISPLMQVYQVVAKPVVEVSIRSLYYYPFFLSLSPH